MLVGDPAAVELHGQGVGLSLRLRVISQATHTDWSDGAINLLDARDGGNLPVEFGMVDAAYGRASLSSARRAIKAALAAMWMP
jgi:hypothetical protein